MMNKLNFCIVAAMIVLSSCAEDGELVEKASVGAQLDIEVGGETQPNQVFVDLSSDKQQVIDRSSWDFGFYSGASNSVILNAASGMLAYQLDKSDLAAVTVEDTLGLGEILSLEAIFASLFLPEAPDWLFSSVDWVDDPTGDLSKTAISSISENANSNLVYIINRGSTAAGMNRGWIKLKVDFIDGAYSVKYADISDQDFNEITVEKEDDYNFSYLSIDNGLVMVEPESESWDLALTTYIDIQNFGVEFPYGVKDWVIQNRTIKTAQVSVVENILTEFQEFTAEDVDGLTFSSDVDAIGGSWRTVASPTPGSVTAVVDDKFYVIEDTDGNYYKLVFTGMLSTTGERGYPQIQYELIN